MLPYALAHEPWLLRHRLYGRLFWISPERIVGKPAAEGDWEAVRSTDVALYRRMCACPLVDGDWDLQPRPFGIQRVVRELFVEGLAPEETSTFDQMVRAVEAGELVRSRGCRSVEEVKDFFDRLQALYESMAHDGYKSQRELGRGPEDEITVCIGRDSSILLLRYGNHRTSIARILRIPQVAVRVAGAHTRWVALQQAQGSDENPVRATERGLENLFAQPRPAAIAKGKNSLGAI